MADKVSDVNIEKGVHLSVIVEFCAQNIIVVCFKNKDKNFRGVLLESDGGLFPFSFPFLKSHPSCPSVKSAFKSEISSPSKNDPSEQPESADKNPPPTPEVPATTQRFSYNKDPFLINPTPTPELTVVEMKPIAPRTKTIRDIRLRPRQTLCSNCKSAIHEGRKTRSNSLSNQSKITSTGTTTTTTSISTSDSRLRPRVNGSVTHISPLKSRPPKRKSETQSPMVLLEDIRHKSTRFSTSKDQKRSGNSGAAENEPSHSNKSHFESSVESLTKTTNRLRASRRSLLSETNINHDANVQLNCLSKEDPSDISSLKSGKKNKLSNHELSSRPSPAIKISIKGGAILKIPPRLPDSEMPVVDNALEAQSNIIDHLQFHKKAKKSAKKAKDRHRIFDGSNGVNILPNGDQASSKALKKHKKKHRHRHQSPEPSKEGKSFGHDLDISSTLNRQTDHFAHKMESGCSKTLLSQESNGDTFPKEINNINTDYANLFKKDPINGNTLDSETYSDSVKRESVLSNVLFDSEAEDMNPRGKDINSLNTSFDSLNNTVNSFYGESKSMNGYSVGTYNSNLSSKTQKYEPFVTHANSYVNFDRDSTNMNKLNECLTNRDSFRPVDNNNIAVKADDNVSIQMVNSESNYNSFGLTRNTSMVHSPIQQKQIRVGDCFIDVVDISDSDSDSEVQGSVSSVTEPANFLSPPRNNDDLSTSRPRLLYTWRQDHGLSRVESEPLPPPTAPPPPRPSLPPPPPPLVPAPVPIPEELSPRYLVKTSPSIIPPNANSPHRRKNASPGRVVNASSNVQFSTNSPLIKDYPLRNRTGSLSTQPSDLLMIAEHGGIVSVSEDSQSHSSGLESRFSDISGDSDEDESQLEDIFAPCSGGPISQDEDDKDLSKPLMLKIQTQSVTECVLNEGRMIRVGDIVWGKIQGFPWWPGRVSSITVTQTQRDNNVVMDQLAQVAWFGSNTMSHVHCCDLDPFLEFFKSRYNKKKKGPYKMAIKQATQAAQKLATGLSRSDILDFTD